MSANKDKVTSGLETYNTAIDINKVVPGELTDGGHLEAAQLGPDDEIIYPEDGSAPTQFRRRLVRRHEVPFKRKVKVPVTTKKVVPTTFEKKIKVKKLVQVPDYEEVTETYTVFEDEPATREKKIWVEKTIQEDYIKKIPQVKTRMVKKPITRIEERDDFQVVNVDENKVIEVDGFRVDEIEDRKWVEYEEWEVYELMPHKTGQLIRGETKELGRVWSKNTNRRTGTQIFHSENMHQAGDLNEVEDDDNHEHTFQGISTSLHTGGSIEGYTSAQIAKGSWGESQPVEAKKAAPRRRKPQVQAENEEF